MSLLSISWEAWAVMAFFVVIVILFVHSLRYDAKGTTESRRLAERGGTEWYLDAKFRFEALKELLGGLPGIIKAVEEPRDMLEAYFNPLPKGRREWKVNDLLHCLGFTFSWCVDDKQNVLLFSCVLSPSRTERPQQERFSVFLTEHEEGVRLFQAAVKRYMKAPGIERIAVRGGGGYTLPLRLEDAERILNS